MANTITTYPNGQQLSSSALTQTAISILVQQITCGMLGINPVDPAKVRIDWPTQGQPDVPLPSNDICYIACTTQDGEYNKVRDRTASGTGPVVQTWNYTRIWRVEWSLYGPNSTDRARQVWSALFQDYFNDQFELNNLYPVLDPPEPIRLPENHNAQWYDGSRFHCEFYEAVTETISDPAVQSVEAKVYDGSVDDPVADITITR